MDDNKGIVCILSSYQDIECGYLHTSNIKKNIIIVCQTIAKS